MSYKSTTYRTLKKHRQVRFSEGLDARVAQKMERDKKSFSETVRDLVEWGLLYGDAKNYDLSKSVTDLANSYDDMQYQVAAMEGELAETIRVVSELKLQVEAHLPTILRTLGEVTLLCRLLALEKSPAAIRQVGNNIEKQFEILSQSVAEEVDRRTRKPGQSRRA